MNNNDTSELLLFALTTSSLYNRRKIIQTSIQRQIDGWVTELEQEHFNITSDMALEGFIISRSECDKLKVKFVARNLKKLQAKLWRVWVRSALVQYRREIDKDFECSEDDLKKYAEELVGYYPEGLGD